MTEFQLQEDRDRMARKRLVGMILMTAGGVMALLCGLCTLGVSAVFIVSAFTSPGLPVTLLDLIVPLIVGGLPTVVGAVLFWIGRGMYREGAARQGHPERAFD